MTRNRLFIIVCAILGIIACDKVDERTYGSEFEAHTPIMEFGQSSQVNISKDGETIDISFTCTRDWKAAWKEDWVSISPASGNGSEEPQTIRLSAVQNSEYIRSASINFTAGYPLSATLTINQDGIPMPDPVLELLPESMQVPAADTEAKFTVDANRDWIISFEDKQYSVTPLSGSSGLTEVTVNFTANREEEEKTAEFTVSLVEGEITKTFTLVREAAGPDPNRKYYALIKERPDNYDGKYLVVYRNGDTYLAMNPTDIGSVKANYASPVEITVVDDYIEATDSIDKMSFSIVQHGKLGEGWYSFVRSDGNYFYGGAEDKTEFLTKNTETANGSTITYLEEGNHFSMCYRGTNPLIYHKSNQAFVFIKKANAGNKDCGEILLFKRFGPIEQ